MKTFILPLLLVSTICYSQVGIGTTSPDALVDFTISGSTPIQKDGFMPPRLSSFPSINPSANQVGLLTTIDGAGYGYEYMYWNGTAWITITNRIRQKINDMADGKSDNDGTDNGSSIFLGFNSGVNDDQSDNRNIGVGFGSLFSGITAEQNVAVGYESLFSLVSGYANTAVGYQSLYNNTGDNNTAIGYKSLFANTTGLFNTAVGSESLLSNTTGEHNTAAGNSSLRNNSIGNRNSALGSSAMYSNTQGNDNSAMGYYSLLNNITGSKNVAIGSQALRANQTSNDNVAIGEKALLTSTGIRNTAVGVSSGSGLTSGSFNTFLGSYAQTTVGSIFNSTAIGYLATVTGSNMIRFGNVWVTSIGGNGNWTNVSDKRFKMNTKEDIKGLEFILQLRPLTYDLDKQAINTFLSVSNVSEVNKEKPQRQIGLIAQEVEAVAKKIGFRFHGIDTPNNEKDFYGLRYAEFVVPLVKAVQEQQEVIEVNTQLINVLESRLKKLNSLKVRLDNLKNAGHEN